VAWGSWGINAMGAVVGAGIAIGHGYGPQPVHRLTIYLNDVIIFAACDRAGAGERLCASNFTATQSKKCTPGAAAKGA